MSHAPSGQLDCAPQLVWSHRAGEDEVRCKQLREPRVGREVTGVVRSDRDHDDGFFRSVRQVDETFDERSILGFVFSRRENLLELVDNQYESVATLTRAKGRLEGGKGTRTRPDD